MEYANKSTLTFINFHNIHILRHLRFLTTIVYWRFNHSLIFLLQKKILQTVITKILSV